MKKQTLTFILLFTLATMMQAQTYLLKDNGSGSYTTSGVIESGQKIGIGTAQPNSPLHIAAQGFTPELIRATINGSTQTRPDYFLAERLDPNNILYPVINDFVVTGHGKVGIGMREPEAILEIKARGWPSDPQNPFDPPLPVFAAVDNNDNILAALFNVGTNTESGAAFAVFGKSDQPAFGVVNQQTSQLPFVVIGDGSVGLGLDNANLAKPEAQLDLRHNGIQNNIMQVMTVWADESFNINALGSVGIGTSTHSGLLTINSGGLSQLAGTPQLWIDNGNNQEPYLAVRDKQIGIGKDPLNGGELVIKGQTGTAIDLHRVAATGWDGQIRWVAENQYRHLLFDNEGTLTIDPGYQNGNNLLRVEGNETVSGDEQVKGKLLVGTNTTITGSEIVAIDGKVRIGDPLITNSNYSSAMLSVEGLIICNRAVVKVNEWQDTVFDPSYKLMSIDKVSEYVTKYRHLPDIPAEKDVLDEGVNIGEMNALLLKKIEELTLYTIELNKRLTDLEKK